MGTRNLTMVRLGGELRVAQYGQWDGYPTGQGATIAKFLRENAGTGLEVFKQRVAGLQWATKEHVKCTWVEAGADPESAYVSLDVSKKHGAAYPEFSRDTGAGILEVIQGGADFVQDRSEFLNDSLFCEYAYCVDLDKSVVEVYKGFQAVGEENGRTKYGPCKLFATIPFAEFVPEAMVALEKSMHPDDE